MKGYKAFDKYMQCRDYQFEIGKTYTFDGNPIPCRQGFHFCKSVADCYSYYPMNEDTRVCEVEAIGDVETDDDVKYCTNKIMIIREVENPREASNASVSSSGYCNSGNCNSGNRNSGNCNSGDWNSGNCNSGDWNSGNWNSGDWNSGDWNSGNCNSGNRNSGNWNSGDCNSGNRNSGNCNSGNRNSGNCNSGNCNSGNRNSGDWNSGNCNSGVFCSDSKIKIFDKESDWTIEDWYNSKARTVMYYCPCSYSYFVYAGNMTVEEKARHPEHETIGGYVKVITVTDEDKQKWWDSLTEDEKQAVYDLPNFDADKFKQCTGIKVEREGKK